MPKFLKKTVFVYFRLKYLARYEIQTGGKISMLSFLHLENEKNVKFFSVETMVIYINLRLILHLINQN